MITKTEYGEKLYCWLREHITNCCRLENVLNFVDEFLLKFPISNDDEREDVMELLEHLKWRFYHESSDLKRIDDIRKRGK